MVSGVLRPSLNGDLLGDPGTLDDNNDLTFGRGASTDSAALNRFGVVAAGGVGVLLVVLLRECGRFGMRYANRVVLKDAASEVEVEVEAMVRSSYYLK